ncbi:MAG: hypothetical protein ACR2M2_03945 [Gaiellaceae bacterium]
MRYEPIWGTNRAGEKAAIERFVDWMSSSERFWQDVGWYRRARG